MPLNLIRRLVKGARLTSNDHDHNLDVLEAAIEDIALTPGNDGEDGREIELQAGETHIQWRYVGDAAWTDLVALAEITGADGREVELQASATHIQWRYSGTASWTNLVALSELIGPPGPDGIVPATLTYTTASLAANASEDFTIAGGDAFQLLSIESSRPAWVRIYGTAAARTADTRTQPGGAVPAAGSEFYAEVATTATPQTIRLSPVPLVQGTNGGAFVRVVNRDSVARTIALSFNVLTLQD
jgi:hypothetical protein